MNSSTYSKSTSMGGKKNSLFVFPVGAIIGLATCLGDIKDVTGCEGFGCEDPTTSEFVYSYTTRGHLAEESGWDHMVNCSGLSYASRAQWGGKTPKYENMEKKVSIVFIHHTVLSHCSTGPGCVAAVLSVQNLHKDVFEWDDIGYNFLVGEDGMIYEARGWDRVGAHTKGFNRIAISIGAMGNFMLQTPNQKLLDAIQAHLDCGVASGKLEPDYKLYGHRDARPTESPGDFLYDIIKTWSHFDLDTPRLIKPPLL